MSAVEQKHTEVSASLKRDSTKSLQRKKLDCGLSVPIILDLDWVKSMKDAVKLRPDDVWIVTYPKSGITWTQQIVRLIINRGENDEKNLTDAVPWVEAFNTMFPGYERINLDEMASPRAFKSHFPYDQMPCGPPNATLGKYIYVVRNPKDVFVSYFIHASSFQAIPQQECDVYFEQFLQGEVSYGSYFDHVLSWWAHKDDNNVLILKYEDMKKDLPSAVATIAKFIGQDISKELVDEIAYRTTFDNMKKDSSANCDWMISAYRNNLNPYMRKGEVGGWKDYITSEQAAMLDSIYEKRLKAVGIDFECLKKDDC